MQNQDYHARQDMREFLDTECQVNSITFRLSVVCSVSMDHCFLLNFVFIIVFISHPIWVSLFFFNYRLYSIRLFFFFFKQDNFLTLMIFVSKYLSIYLLLYLGGVFFLYCSANKMCIAVIYCYMLLYGINTIKLWCIYAQGRFVILSAPTALFPSWSLQLHLRFDVKVI